jgi:hypothetical protein
MADDPSKTSAEYQRMDKRWQLVRDILGGVEAIRRGGDKYLPKYEGESSEEYRRRSQSAPWRPEFVDILQALATKPFGRDVAVKGAPPDEIIGQADPATKSRRGGLVDDIDGRGSSLTTFAAEAFWQGAARGAHAYLVDYPEMAPNASRADEIKAGARPYWVQVPFDSIIALYTDVVEGREVVTHVRIRETRVERDGFGERTIEQVRVLEPGTSQVWERSDKGEWTPGPIKPHLRGGQFSAVPLVLMYFGRRIGALEVMPPLQAVADMQIELYQALSRQEEILTFAGSPMLCGQGIAPPAPGSNDKIEVGPKTVLFAPRNGDGPPPKWDFVQPAAANIAEVRKSVEAIQADMRRIGLQPLTEQPGNPTATGKAIDAAKAHSAVKSWALLLNDALEQGLVFTCEYLRKPTTVQTEVSTDFSVLPYAAEPLKALAEARATKEISHDAYIAGLKRFDALPGDFDAEADKALLAAEPPVPAQTEVQVRT